MTQVGFTPGFAAPELLRTGASAASDLFALGATMAEVAVPSPERDILLRRLQAPEPHLRPSAQQVLNDPYFAPVFAWARDERRTCCICLEDDVRLDEGLECCRSAGAPHFVCNSCLEGHVEAAVGAELRLRQASEGRVRCPGRPCDATAYTDLELAKCLPSAVFRRYTESRLDLLEQRRAAELEGEMQARLGAELRRLQALDEQQRQIRTVRSRIVEDILTLKCPRCGQAFLDFVGCFALSCSRCPCGFCAWCGADSGSSNAHEHVRTCREKPPGADDFFGSFEQFELAQRRRRRRLLGEFLPTLDVETRAAVLHEMRRDLADLGLDDIADAAQQQQQQPEPHAQQQEQQPQPQEQLFPPGMNVLGHQQALLQQQRLQQLQQQRLQLLHQQQLRDHQQQLQQPPLLPHLPPPPQPPPPLMHPRLAPQQPQQQQHFHHHHPQQLGPQQPLHPHHAAAAALAQAHAAHVAAHAAHHVAVANHAGHAAPHQIHHQHAVHVAAHVHPAHFAAHAVAAHAAHAPANPPM